MIVGIGTDICDINRVTRLYKKYGTRLVTKILTEKEERHLPTQERAAWLAKRFAAKEALSKAFGTGFSDGLTFKDFSILNNNKGAPEVVLSKNAQDKLPPECKIHISLSDEKAYALAFIVIEQNSEK